MSLEGILGGLHSLLDLQPVEVELILDIVDHDGLIVTTGVATVLGGRVGTLQLEILVLLLQELAAVALPQETILLDLEGVGEEFVVGDDVLEG